MSNIQIDINFPKLVLITWIDVQALESGLLTKDDIVDLKPATAWLAGFLVRETGENYYVAKELWETRQFKYLHVIPKRSVIGIKVFKEFTMELIKKTKR